MAHPVDVDVLNTKVAVDYFDYNLFGVFLSIAAAAL